jgi:hypothetical protein
MTTIDLCLSFFFSGRSFAAEHQRSNCTLVGSSGSILAVVIVSG